MKTTGTPGYWFLKTPCPCCEGKRLQLLACRRCGHVVARCHARGTTYFDVCTLETPTTEAAEGFCPTCGDGPAAFELAGADQIYATGLHTWDFE